MKGFVYAYSIYIDEGFCICLKYILLMKGFVYAYSIYIDEGFCICLQYIY